MGRMLNNVLQTTMRAEHYISRPMADSWYAADYERGRQAFPLLSLETGKKFFRSYATALPGDVCGVSVCFAHPRGGILTGDVLLLGIGSCGLNVAQMAIEDNMER